MRLMEAAKQMSELVRWRMAPKGVAADAYLVHRFSAVDYSNANLQAANVDKPSAKDATTSDFKAGSKLMLDALGQHRGRPVCILGQSVETSELDPTQIAPLHFPDALQEMARGLNPLVQELVRVRMLYAVGLLAWPHRQKWGSHRLHMIEAGQLIAVVDAVTWQFFLREGCSVDRMNRSDVVTMPRSGGFSADGFLVQKFEMALWELAKRCEGAMLDELLPANYLQKPLTHRRAPHLTEHALGDHCASILKALDTRPHTAAELQNALGLTGTALVRALSCLALVRAIKPATPAFGGMLQRLGGLWSRIVGNRALPP